MNLNERLPPPLDTKRINPGSRLPNAIFARKHHIQPNDRALPKAVQNGAIRPSADDVILQRCEKLCSDALAIVEKLPGVENLTERERRRQESQAVGAYIRNCKAPATPGLFFDSGLDFKWEEASPS